MKLGVQTHFAHGWPVDQANLLVQVGIHHARDEQYWNEVELTKGNYTFNTKLSSYMSALQGGMVEPLITLSFSNALYDNGQTPYTQEACNAFAAYAVAVLRHYGSQIKTVEVWNEYNGDSFVTGPARNDRPGSYRRLLEATYTAIKAEFPNVTVLGASTVAIPLPYLESLFAAGCLPFMDGVSVHPYRDDPRGVDGELRALKALMAQYGGEKPIYATEFGYDGGSEFGAPDYFAKMVTLMASEGVSAAYWYLLRDYDVFIKRGLFTADGVGYPMRDAFRFFNDTILPKGNPVRVDVGNPEAFVYRFGSDTYVAWGSPVAISGTFTSFDTTGKASGLNDVTVIQGSDITFVAEAPTLITNSATDYETPAWSYFYRSTDGSLIPLVDKTNQWETYLGHDAVLWLKVTPTQIHPGAGTPVVMRYTMPEAGQVLISGSWETIDPLSNGVTVDILKNGSPIASGLAHPDYFVDGLSIDVAVGDQLDFIVGDNGDLGYDATNVDITIRRGSGSVVEPPPEEPPVSGLFTEDEKTQIRATFEMILSKL